MKDMRIYYDVRSFYVKIVKRRKYKITSVIESIERYNRPFLWRLCEYTYLVIHMSVLNSFRNITIGVYQINVKSLLEQLNESYGYRNEKLFVTSNSRFALFYELTKIANKELTFLKYISDFIDIEKIENLNNKDLYNFFALYNGRSSFNDEPNYYTIGYRLYNS